MKDRRSVVLIACCVAGLVFCAGLLPRHSGWVGAPWRLSGVQDATAFRAGAELAGTPGLYDPERIAAAQIRNTGTADGFRMFLRQPW